jgi:hypothetical protein
MKKILLLAFILLSVSFSFGQKNWKRYLFTGSSMFISGALDGTIESLSYHYNNGFKLRCKNVNNQFWDPAISWQNKYKNGNCNMGEKFYGSTSVFAFTTDAYHLLRTCKRTVGGLTLAYYVNESCSYRKTVTKKQMWKRTLKDFAILTAIRCVGFTATYSLLFKRNPNIAP